MFVAFIFQVLLSPLLTKILVIACSAVFLNFLRIRDSESKAASFFYIALFCIFRDILFQIFELPELILLSDIILFTGILAVILNSYTNLKRFIPLLGLVNALFMVMYALRIIYGINLGLPELTYGLVLIVDTVVLAIIGLIKRNDRENSNTILIASVWIPVSLLLAAYGTAVLVLGYKNSIFNGFIWPFSYLWLLVVALYALKNRYDETISAVSYYESSIDSLYNLSHKIGISLKDNFAVNEVVSVLNSALMNETHADGGAIYLVDELDGLIITKTVEGIFPPPFPLPENLPKNKRRIDSFVRHAQFRIGENILGEIAKTAKNMFVPLVSEDKHFSFITENAAADTAVHEPGELDTLYSFMALPLMLEDRVIGLSALARTRAEAFSEDDFDKYKLLVNFGSLSLSNVFSFMEVTERGDIERSARIAAEIQAAIVPKKLPQLSKLSVGAFSTPARGVSGDYYDVMRTREDRLVGVIGDVAGKGVQAAIIIVMIRSILQLITNTDKDVSTILDWVNKGITGRIELDHYATLSIVAINTFSGEMEYANAGHQPLLIYRRASNSIEAVEVKSVPIGVERNNPYQRKALRLFDGDIVLMYTDGIVEAMNEQGRQFGRKNLGQIVVNNKDNDATVIAAKIKSELMVFRGDTRQHDDQTVLVFKMKAQ